MAIQPGKPVTPSVLDDLDNDSVTTELVTISPTPSAAALHVALNHGYNVYADNVDNGGTSGNRLWIDTPDNASVAIGPRAGGSLMADLRLRVDTLSGTTANMVLNSSTYAVTRITSSRRYKQDIVDATPFNLDALRRLRPVEYRSIGEVEARARWEARRDAGEDLTDVDEPPIARLHVGMIAEEVDELGLAAFVVYRDDDGTPESLAYDRMVLGAFQLIANLEQRLADQDRRLAALELLVGKKGTK